MGDAAPLGGTLPVLPTPFHGGRVDYDSLERLLEFVLPGVDGYTVAGSTGEAPSMSLAERKEVAKFVLTRTPADKTVVVGIAHTDVHAAAELARHAADHGARACLVPSPFYFPNSAAGVASYLERLAQASDIDLVFYDNPYSTKTFYSPPDLEALAERVERVVGIKVTDHAIEKIAWLKEHTDLVVFAGDDVVLLRSLLLGADGCMVIAPAVFPEAYRESWELLQAGKEADACEVFSGRILPFIHVFGMGREIAATKALYQHLGLFTSDEVRPPLEPCDETWRRHLVIAYDCCAKE